MSEVPRVLTGDLAMRRRVQAPSRVRVRLQGGGDLLAKRIDLLQRRLLDDSDKVLRSFGFAPEEVN